MMNQIIGIIALLTILMLSLIGKTKEKVVAKRK